MTSRRRPLSRSRCPARLGALVLAAVPLAACTAPPTSTAGAPHLSSNPGPVPPTALTPPSSAPPVDADPPAPSACLPSLRPIAAGISGTQLAVCSGPPCGTPTACIAYDLLSRRWSHLDAASAGTPSLRAAACAAGEGPALPPGFSGPERPARWSTSLAGNELRACPAPGASDCIVLHLAERWVSPPSVVVSADRRGAVVWGRPDGKRRAAAIHDARSGRLLHALEAFPGNRHIARFAVEAVGAWGDILWASWPACEDAPCTETWIFDALGRAPRLLAGQVPAYARYDDRLELLGPLGSGIADEGKATLLDRHTGETVAAYPLGYRGPGEASLLALGKGQFVMVFGGRMVRVSPRGDDDHPDVAEFLVLDVDAAMAGGPIVRSAGRFPSCEPEPRQ